TPAFSSYTLHRAVNRFKKLERTAWTYAPPHPVVRITDRKMGGRIGPAHRTAHPRMSKRVRVGAKDPRFFFHKTAGPTKRLSERAIEIRPPASRTRQRRGFWPKNACTLQAAVGRKGRIGARHTHGSPRRRRPWKLMPIHFWRIVRR